MKKDFLVYGLPVIIAIIIFLIIRFGFMGSYHITNITLDKYHELAQAETQSIVFIVNSSEEASKQTINTLKKVFYGSKIKTNMLDIAKFSDEEILKLLEENTLFEDKISVPTLAVIENQKIVAKLSGIFNEDEIVQFVQENGLKK